MALPKSILKTSNGNGRNTSGVHFEPPKDLSETLQAAVDNPLIRDELDGFVTHMKNQQGAALVEWLQQIQDNLNLIKPSLETFVLAILSIPWADQEHSVIAAYKHFLTDLISAQSYYTKPVVKMLMTSMLGGDKDSINEKETLANIHDALRSVVRISPLAANTSILSYGKSCMPFMMTPQTHKHTKYLDNLLTVSDYLPSERISLLTLVIERLVQLDANLPSGVDSLYEEDEELPENMAKRRTREQLCRDNLDQGMSVIYTFIEAHGKSESELLNLYEVIFQVFESNVLPSYATGHVQFVMFYLLSLSPQILTWKFLGEMWKKFISPSEASLIRQTAIAYVASFIARAKFAGPTVLRHYLKKINGWIISYLSARVDMGNDCNYVDVRAHGPFYAACQALFYMLAFRYEELTQDPKNLEFLGGLRLGHIVLSPLNPLKVCLPSVVKYFATIARHYQLAYCETVIQRNNRLNLPVVGTMSSSTSVISDAKPALLDTFFPFDPYRLKDSKSFISAQYREFKGFAIDNDSDEDSESEYEEDEENEQVPLAKRRRLNSSGSLLELDLISPGFVQVDSK